MSRIVIQTGARLHFGLLALGQSPPDGSEPGTGREFGGVGLMVKSPGFRISLAPNSPIENLADSIVHLGSSPAPALELIDRVGRILSRYRERCPAEFRPAGMQIELQETVSQHIGLGTGTQLALAIARGLAEIMGEGPLPVSELARRVDRGQRSAIGLYGFEHGGLLVEGGKKDRSSVSPLIARLAVPAGWRFLLARPREFVGLSGEAECQGFRQLSAMPTAVTDRLCRLLLMGLLPSVSEGDFAGFCQSLQSYGDTVGQFFASVQTGVYASTRMAELSEILHRQGIVGIAQTSWGPTVAIPCEGVAFAEHWHQKLSGDTYWRDCQFEIVSPMNTGARLSSRER